MNTTRCTVENCQSAPATSQPIPLCTRHGVEVALAVLPLALAGTLAEVAGEAGEDLADLQGRVGRRWRQGQINAVLAWIREAGDAKAVSLKDVMDRLHLTQTTAYDRLSPPRPCSPKRRSRSRPEEPFVQQTRPTVRPRTAPHPAAPGRAQAAAENNRPKLMERKCRR